MIQSLGEIYILAILPAASDFVFLNIFMDNIAGHTNLYDPNNISLRRPGLMIFSLRIPIWTERFFGLIQRLSINRSAESELK